MAKTEDQGRDEQKAAVKTVRMHRELLPKEVGPTTADVHPDEVGNYRAGGWRITDPK